MRESQLALVLKHRLSSKRVFRNNYRIVSHIKLLPYKSVVIKPMSGSILDMDHKAIAPLDSFEVVRRQILVSLDHLDAATRLLYRNSSKNAYSIYTLLRSSIELSCTGLWLICPANPEERAEHLLRYTTTNINGISNYNATFPNMGQGSSEIAESIAEWRGDLLTTVLAAYPSLYQPKLIKRSYSMTQDVLPFVVAMDEFLPMADHDIAKQWMLCSGVAHGYDWNHDLLFEELGKEPKRWNKTTVISQEDAVRVSNAAVYALVTLMKKHIKLAGLDHALDVPVEFPHLAHLS